MELIYPVGVNTPQSVYAVILYKVRERQGVEAAVREAGQQLVPGADRHRSGRGAGEAAG